MNKRTGNFLEYASGNVVTLKETDATTMGNIFYDILKQHGYYPSDTLHTMKPKTHEAIIKPWGTMLSGNVRMALIFAAIEHGWDVVITPNH